MFFPNPRVSFFASRVGGAFFFGGGGGGGNLKPFSTTRGVFLAPRCFGPRGKNLLLRGGGGGFFSFKFLPKNPAFSNKKGGPMGLFVKWPFLPKPKPQGFPPFPFGFPKKGGEGGLINLGVLVPTPRGDNNTKNHQTQKKFFFFPTPIPQF